MERKRPVTESSAVRSEVKILSVTVTVQEKGGCISAASLPVVLPVFIMLREEGEGDCGLGKEPPVAPWSTKARRSKGGMRARKAKTPDSLGAVGSVVY